MWRAPGLDPERISVFAEILWRTLVVGTALFMIPPTGMAPTPAQLALAFLLVTLWSYGHGLVGRSDWPLSVLEAALWLFIGTRWTAVMLLIFGRSAQWGP